jgi:hypothetical protein
VSSLIFAVAIILGALFGGCAASDSPGLHLVAWGIAIIAAVWFIEGLFGWNPFQRSANADRGLPTSTQSIPMPPCKPPKPAARPGGPHPPELRVLVYMCSKDGINWMICEPPPEVVARSPPPPPQAPPNVLDRDIG